MPWFQNSKTQQSTPKTSRRRKRKTDKWKHTMFWKIFWYCFYPFYHANKFIKQQVSTHSSSIKHATSLKGWHKEIELTIRGGKKTNSRRRNENAAKPFVIRHFARISLHAQSKLNTTMQTSYFTSWKLSDLDTKSRTTSMQNLNDSSNFKQSLQIFCNIEILCNAILLSKGNN